MRSLRIFLLLGAMVALFGLVAAPLAAQDQGGQGGVIVEGGFGNDPETFNPLLVKTTDAGLVTSFMFPVFIGIDPKSANFAPGAPGSIAKDWKVSDDGKVYTFTLRDDWK